jgi:hypothetical protein
VVVESTCVGDGQLGRGGLRRLYIVFGWARETLVSGDESDDPGMTLAVRGRCWCDQFQAM